MKPSTTRSLALILLTTALFSCSNEWVQLTPQAQNVTVATPEQVAQCTRAGTANVMATDNIAFVNRSARQLQEDLLRLARNEAGDLGGNRIVAESPINQGRQTFGIYRC